jgi:4-hydroxy 2-oxovalerate aldolase
MNSNIKVLDCTLRDGGHVNDFNFGDYNIKKIIKGLVNSHVDIIELGFLMNGNHDKSQTLYNTVSEAEIHLSDISTESEFCLMIRPDWYDINQLEKCSGKIKSIRFAFYQKDLELTLHQATIARNYGYGVYLNPVNVFSYSNSGLANILKVLNNFKPKAISIVDTFGSMLPEDLVKLFEIFNNNVDKDITLGLHLHENLSISLALAQQFLGLVGVNSRNAIIDSSILGMGRIPGNLCSELIMNYLNIKDISQYNLTNIYELISDPISEIKNQIPWGYMPAYAITAYLKMHRSYAEYMIEQTKFSLHEIEFILLKIEIDDYKDNYNEKLIESMCNDYLNSKI